MKKTIISLLSAGAFILLAATVSAAGNYNIVDVTDGKVFRGVSTPSDAVWKAHAGYRDGKYILQADFQKLGDPQGTDFYEGWVVRKSPFAFISTGKLEKINGEYTNNFTSSIDYTDYDFYVLTLEPDDGNPAPADHIVEGDVQELVVSADNVDSKNHKVFNITGKNFAFSTEEIRVKKGDTVTINFESTDGFHDWVVDEFDAATNQVSTWGKTSVTFIADTAGIFEYYCSVGNHRAAGMVGKLIVEDTTNISKTVKDPKQKSLAKSPLDPRKKIIRDRIEKALPNISEKQVRNLFQRVTAFRERVKDFNISGARKAQYNEILDLFIQVLSDIKIEMKQ